MNFTPPVLSVVISAVRYCTSLQRRACGIKAEIINEHLEMNSLLRLVGVTLSGEQAGLPSPKAVTDAWGGFVRSGAFPGAAVCLHQQHALI